MSRLTIYGSEFNIELRDPAKEHCYLKIGDNGIIEGSFIFETNKGKIEIGNRVHIGSGTSLISRSQIIIEDDVTIAWNCTIYDHNSHSIYWSERSNDTMQEFLDYKEHGNFIAKKNWDMVVSKPILIHKRVWIGYGVSILKGVTVGEGAVIGACSVVTKDVPPYTVVAGNPAVIVRQLEGEYGNCEKLPDHI